MLLVVGIAFKTSAGSREVAILGRSEEGVAAKNVVFE